jgi:hypothetical protein
MGFDPSERQASSGRAPRYIDFLDQLPALLADQQRRAHEGSRPIDPPHGRIETPVRDLDQVAARQWDQPGGVVLGEAPTVKELIAAGDDAVEPLIRALRSDQRLTRSVGFHRDFFRNRTILGAGQAAYTALTGILEATNFGPP